MIMALKPRNPANSFLALGLRANHDSVAASEGTMRPKKHGMTGSSELCRAAAGRQASDAAG
jgi:hypothetical protein